MSTPTTTSTRQSGTCVFCASGVYQLDESQVALVTVPPFLADAKPGDWASVMTGVFCAFRGEPGTAPLGKHAVYAEVGTPEPRPGGDVGGDGQVTHAWSRQFVRPLRDGTFAVITVYVYVHDERMRTADDTLTDPLSMTRQTEFTVCRNPADVGSTDEFSDSTYVPVPGVANTEDAARAVCAAVDPAQFTWDGTPQLRHDQIA